MESNNNFDEFSNNTNGNGAVNNHQQQHTNDFNHNNDYDDSMIKTLLSWHAPGRPFVKRSREYYATSLLIALLIEVLCFFFAQYMLMLLIASFVFVAFMLATVPPHDFRYKISTEGITVEDHFYLWQELYDFYFKKINGMTVLQMRTVALIPGELTITLGEISPDHLRQVLLPFLPYREVTRKNITEKAGDFLSKNFPLERKKVAS